MKNLMIVIMALIGLGEWADAEPVVKIPSTLYQAGADEITPAVRKIPSQLDYVYRAAADKYKFCHHPCLIEFKEQLYCVWSNGKIGEDEPGQRLAMATSRDAQNWTAARPLFSTEQLAKYEHCVFVASGLMVRQDKLVVFYTITPGENFAADTALYFSQSFDGKVWSDPQRITAGFFINPPVILSGGRLMMGGEYVSQADRKNKRSKLIYHDGDCLATGWTETKIDEGDFTRIGYAEPNFIERDHDVLGFFRNYTGRLLVSRSTDRGQNWSPLSESAIPDSTARFATGNLSGDRRYLIGNSLHKKFDRRALLISISDDQGASFDRCFILRDEPAAKRFPGQHKMDGWQYPHGCLWKNQLLVVHSVNKEDVAISAVKLSDLQAEKKD
ncbi:MAG: hypothetical protein CMJ76_01945 [Planctomycetaceae bacterium]|nr:hypothetical protein [Planctomycetaceae bacterium]